MPVGRHRSPVCGGGVALIESLGNGAPTQEGPSQSLPVGVLLVCVSVGIPQTAPISPVSVPELKK
jgi:hypothetical protein